MVVGHLAGQFADGREAQVDRRWREALGEQPAAVGVGQGLREGGSRLLAALFPGLLAALGEELPEAFLIGAAGAQRGDAVEHQADQPGLELVCRVLTDWKWSEAME